MTMSIGRRGASMSVGAATAALMIAGVAGAGTAAPPDGTTEEQVSVAATCQQPPALPQQSGSARYFLKIEGIRGESNDDRHADEIDIDSLGWAVSENALLTCQPEVRRSVFQPILVSKRIDRSSPRLMEAAAAGTHFATATLSMDKGGEGRITFIRIKLTDAVVSAYRMGAGGGRLPADGFSLNYTTITVEYVPQRSDGGPGETVSFCWNVKQNRVCPTAPPVPTPVPTPTP
jgi:type VI secretion system secreted protein Hcp